MIYTKTVDWAGFYTQLDRVLKEMAGERFDMLVAIAHGGIVPAALLREERGIPMHIIRLAYRDEKNAPLYEDARLLETVPFPHRGRRILLVDDVSRTGKTLSRAKAYCDGNEVRSFLVNGRADYRLFDTDECLRMPWKRERAPS